MEKFDLYDENKKPTGETLERGKPIPENRFKLSMHMWITNSENKIYVQKRASTRKLFPNLWENPGGSVLAGETSEQAFKREFLEELGIEPNFNKAIMFNTIKRSKDFVDIWYLKQDFKIEDLSLQKEEVSSAKWVSKDELDAMIKNNECCPTFGESYIPFLKFYESEAENQL